MSRPLFFPWWMELLLVVFIGAVLDSTHTFLHIFLFFKIVLPSLSYMIEFAVRQIILHRIITIPFKLQTLNKYNVVAKESRRKTKVEKANEYRGKRKFKNNSKVMNHISNKIIDDECCPSEVGNISINNYPDRISLSSNGWLLISMIIFLSSNLCFLVVRSTLITYTLNCCALASFFEYMKETIQKISPTVKVSSLIFSWLYFVKFIGEWQLRMDLMNHGILPAIFVAIISLGYRNRKCIERQSRYDLMRGPLVKRHPTSFIADAIVDSYLICILWAPLFLCHTNKKRFKSIFARNARLLLPLLKAFVLATCITFTSFAFAYWCLTATNYGWVSNIRNISKMHELNGIDPHLRLHARTLEYKRLILPPSTKGKKPFTQKKSQLIDSSFASQHHYSNVKNNQLICGHADLDSNQTTKSASIAKGLSNKFIGDNYNPILNNNSRDCFPIVVKPNQCTTNSRGVEVMHTLDDVYHYIAKRQRETEGKEKETMLQQYMGKGEEFVIFYVRFPYFPFFSKAYHDTFFYRILGNRAGFIKSIGRRNIQVPFSSAKVKRKRWNNDLSKEKNINSNKETHGSYTIEEADDLFTISLLSAINKISMNMTGFHSGRIDVMAKNIASFRHGDFRILEINQNAIGCISEKPCCCTSYFRHHKPISSKHHNRNNPIRIKVDTNVGNSAKRNITGNERNINYWMFPHKRKWYHSKWMIPFRATRTMTMQIWIGFHNILQGNVPLSTLLVEGLPSFHKRELLCGLGNHEHYVARP